MTNKQKTNKKNNKPKKGLGRAGQGRGITTGLQNYRTKIFYTYIPYYKKTEIRVIHKCKGPTDRWTDGQRRDGLTDGLTDLAKRRVATKRHMTRSFTTITSMFSICYEKFCQPHDPPTIYLTVESRHNLEPDQLFLIGHPFR